MIIIVIIVIWNSSVSAVTRQRNMRSEVRWPAGPRVFLFLSNGQHRSGAHPYTCLMVTGEGGVKRLGPEADSPTRGAEVQNEWSCTPAPPYALLAWTGITLTFIVVIIV